MVTTVDIRPQRTLAPLGLGRLNLILIWAAIAVLVAVIVIVLGALFSS
jgi:hypothetical protein